MKPVPPGDDICPVPAPLDEDPPHDRFCDLVLTGGVASGVVYPWAIVEIARAYRFRSIGGTSVGAMAAALAAAAEYGRCTGFEYPFETLRRLPAALGEDLKEGRTRLLSLFQPAPHGRRLIRLWARLFRGKPDPNQGAAQRPRWLEVARAYFVPIGLGTIVGQLVSMHSHTAFQAGQTYFLLYLNPNGKVRQGDQLDLSGGAAADSYAGIPVE